MKLSDTSAGANLDIEPYALYPSEDSINIRWASATPCRGEVTFYEAAGSHSQKRSAVEDKEGCFHSLTLNGLKPGAAYSYHVGGQGKEYGFRTTSAEKDRSFRFVVFGDPQGHKSLEETMSVAASFDIDFALGLGDFVWGADDDSYARYFEKSRRLLDAAALCPTPGNHDYRKCSRPFDADNDTDVYDKYLGNGGDNNYFFDHGVFRFIMLNYPDVRAVDRGSAAGKWLVGELREARALGKKVVLSHHCPCFTSTEVDWAVDDSLVPPLAEEFRDTLLIDFGAHIHTYERSLYPDESGVCFVTTGGAGELYSYPVNRRENKYQHAAADACHICVVEADETGLRLKAVGTNGDILDRHEIKI